jgi:TPR repeat protein
MARFDNRPVAGANQKPIREGAMRFRFWLCVALAYVAGPVVAQTSEDASDVYAAIFAREVALYSQEGRQQTDDAFRVIIPEYEALAATGDTRAMFRLANIAKRLDDDAMMFRWLRVLDELGHAEGQYYLASALRSTPDCSEARGLMEKSAAGGYDVATSSLGFFYDRGICGDADDAKAVIWYEKAALLGIGVAQHNLAFKYHDGKGVKKDRVRAVAWFHIASLHPYGSERRTAEWSPYDSEEMVRRIRLSGKTRAEAWQMAYTLCTETQACSKIPENRRISSPLPPSLNN